MKKSTSKSESERENRYTDFHRATTGIATIPSTTSSSPCVTISVSVCRGLSREGSQRLASCDRASSATLVVQNRTSEKTSITMLTRMYGIGTMALEPRQSAQREEDSLVDRPVHPLVVEGARHRRELVAELARGRGHRMGFDGLRI